MGLPLAAIHAPIHGYAEQLAAGVAHFVRTLPAGPIYARANWFVVPTVRCERQTLRRLPRTGAVLFTIAVAVARLDRLAPALVGRIAAALAAQGAGEQGRRAVPFYAGALAGYAARRSSTEAA